MDNNNIKMEKTIFELLQEVRYEMSKVQLKKSGYNKHLGFAYPELADILPTATKLLAERGLCPIFCIGYDSNGIEMATLTITKGAERIVFTTPTDSPTNMTGIQALGAKHTYLKRYLYNNLLDIAIPDEVDASLDESSRSAKVDEKKATAKQIEMLRSLYDEENIAKMLDYYGVNSLEEMTLKNASEAIQRKKK